MNTIAQQENNEATALAAAKVAARTAAKGVEMPPVVEQYVEFCAWLLPKVSKFEKTRSTSSPDCRTVRIYPSPHPAN
jgi:hypothetical protein